VPRASHSHCQKCTQGTVLTGFEIAFITLLSFTASVVSVATGFGGGMMLLAFSTLVLPISAVVPLHAVIILASQCNRVWAFRQDIRWDVVRPFVLGSAGGAILGAASYSIMPEFAISLVLGLTLLSLVWLPPSSWRPNLPKPLIWMGVFHTWISTITGVGGLLQGYMIRGDFSRHAIVGTVAGCGMGMTAFKVAGYLWVGFDYSPYLLVIGLALITAVFGTLLGRYALRFISDTQFRVALRWILTLMALRLFWVAWSLY
jgi:uncharacterized protein